MASEEMKNFINILEENNELIRIKEYVNPELEITEITDRVSKSGGGGKALLFENTGTAFPVLINAMGSNKRICLTLGTDNLDKIGEEIETIFRQLTRPRENIWKKLKLLPLLKTMGSWMPKVVSGKGRCQEVIHKNPDLDILPVLRCWPEDGGRFITLPMVITRDPENNARNVGMYRMQLFNKTTTGMHWHPHKTGARHYNLYKAMAKKMPVAVALGGDPVLTYSATAPLPDNIDEYMMAGFLRKKKVDLVKCITNDLEVPAEADIIIEGYIDPDEELAWEGPFGDHTGFYSLPDWFPKFHVTCITNKNNAVYPATIVGIPPQEDAWIIKATERIFLMPMKLTMIPEILDMDMPPEGVAHNLTIIKINKTFQGQTQKVMNAILGAGQMMFAKIMVITGKEIDIHNYQELANYIFENVVVPGDLHYSKGPLDILDHSSTQFAYGSKLCIDATNTIAKETVKQSLFSKIEIDKILKYAGLEQKISGVNVSLLRKKIPALFVSIRKNDHEQPHETGQYLLDKVSVPGIKLLVLVDHGMDMNDISLLVWVAVGNIEPERDIRVNKTETKTYCLIVDATRKSKHDQFEREWPNVIVSDDTTIKTIDKKWNTLGLGKFVHSPSTKLKKMLFPGGAGVIDK
ncbi:MAG: menaquinone biosynthesis decarboxylase [Bacteroidetes bacterium]|nr:menaquinone biosynthesis decarboxylase [Bacteroidota bacterium]